MQVEKIKAKERGNMEPR